VKYFEIISSNNLTLNSYFTNQFYARDCDPRTQKKSPSRVDLLANGCTYSLRKIAQHRVQISELLVDNVTKRNVADLFDGRFFDPFSMIKRYSRCRGGVFAFSWCCRERANAELTTTWTVKMTDGHGKDKHTINPRQSAPDLRQFSPTIRSSSRWLVSVIVGGHSVLF
jgi:hypothetical protein